MPDASSPADRLRAVEERRLRSLVEGDMEVARALHGDDYQLITPGGAALSKQEYLDGIASGQLDYEVFKPASEVVVRVTGEAGNVRYQARIEMNVAGGHDGGLFWHTDYYELRDGRWQAVWSQATRIRT